jgi:hypothetical protein
MQSLLNKIASKKGEVALLKIKKEKAKDKDTFDKKIALLNKEVDKLNDEVDNKKDIRSKLYEDSIKEININKHKYRLAKKLKTITDYMSTNLTSVGIGTTVLTVNTVIDVKDLLSLATNPQQALMYTSMIYVESGAISDRKKAMETTKERLKFLLKRTVSLPKNAFEVAYGITSQKILMSDYEDYIDALIEAGKKAGLKG